MMLNSEFDPNATGFVWFNYTETIQEFRVGHANGSNDTTNIKNAIAACKSNGGGRIIFEDSENYLYNDAFTFDFSNFIVEGNGATMKSIDGTPAYRKTGFNFVNPYRFKVRNFTIDDNRDNRTPLERLSCHSFQLLGGRDGFFENVHAKNSVCDGFYQNALVPSDISTIPSHILFNSCSTDNSYRNGRSVIAGYRCITNNFRYTNANGVAPKAGIDYESDVENVIGSIKQCVENDSYFKGNTLTDCYIATANSWTEDIIFNRPVCEGGTPNNSFILGGKRCKVLNAKFSGFTYNDTSGLIKVPYRSDGWNTDFEIGNITIDDSLRPTSNAGAYLINVCDSADGSFAGAGNGSIHDVTVKGAIASIVRSSAPNVNITKINHDSSYNRAIEIGKNASYNVVDNSGASLIGGQWVSVIEMSGAHHNTYKNITCSNTDILNFGSSKTGGIIKLNGKFGIVDNINLVASPSVASYGINITDGEGYNVTNCNVSGYLQGHEYTFGTATHSGNKINGV